MVGFNGTCSRFERRSRFQSLSLSPFFDSSVTTNFGRRAFALLELPAGLFTANACVRVCVCTG